MSRPVDYEADPVLAELVERLRVGLERHAASPDPALAESVEGAVALLMARNKRLRMLHRMQAQGVMDERPEQMRADLEALDAQLRERLPPLLAQLDARDSPQGA